MKSGHIVFVIFDSKYTDGFTPVSSHFSDQKCTSDIIYICWHISYKKKKTGHLGGKYIEFIF